MNVYSDSIIVWSRMNAVIPKVHSDVIGPEFHQPPQQQRPPRQQPQQQNGHRQCTRHRSFIRNPIDILHGQRHNQIASTLNMINDLDHAKKDFIEMAKEPVPILMNALRIIHVDAINAVLIRMDRINARICFSAPVVIQLTMLAHSALVNIVSMRLGNILRNIAQFNSQKKIELV